jgi:hypothetical protein
LNREGGSIEHTGVAPFVAVVVTYSVMAARLRGMGASSAAGCGPDKEDQAAVE